jgi:hypothetical protein
MKFCWLITLLSTCFGFLVLANVFIAKGISAPQEAAGAAMACALCVIPYVFTRAVEGLARPASAANSAPREWRRAEGEQ